MIKSGIYKITQTDTGRVYVGSSTDLDKRQKQHFSNLRKGKHVNRKMQIDVEEFGIESFHFEVIELLPSDNILLCERERFWQSSLRTELGYNPRKVLRKHTQAAKRPKVHSIFILKNIWEDANRKAGPRQLSRIISQLLTMWLNGDIKIILTPKDYQ